MYINEEKEEDEEEEEEWEEEWDKERERVSRRGGHRYELPAWIKIYSDFSVKRKRSVIFFDYPKRLRKHSFPTAIIPRSSALEAGSLVNNRGLCTYTGAHARSESIEPGGGHAQKTCRK